MKKPNSKTGCGLYLNPYKGKGIYIGKGLLNSLISHLPLELHVPGYSYCGPGTKLKERLARNDKPKNKLDSYCREHDIFYENNPDTASRNKADMRLADQAWERVKASDASLGERAAAYAITNAMKGKAKLGMGLNKKYGQFSAVKTSAKRSPLQRGVHAKRVTKKKGAKK